VDYFSLLLGYIYGFRVDVVDDMAQATQTLMEQGENVRCAFMARGTTLDNLDAASALTRHGQMPLFLLVPEVIIETQRALLGQGGNIYCHASDDWESPMAHRSLRSLLDGALADNQVGGLLAGERQISFRVLQQRVQRRLRYLDTLPTLPEVVLRIMKVAGDPESSAEELEEVLLSDAAVVHKLTQVVNSSFFAGPAKSGNWTLREAIVRLGRRKIGSIALQIKLINSLVKPEESRFDLNRFWIHSVGSALVADRIVQDKLVVIEDWDACRNYWMASLMHDVGELVLGFFFWSYFEQIVDLAESGKMPFREAESHMASGVTHEQVGQLLLLRSGMPRDVVQAVKLHHRPESPPPPLVSLVHLADNLCKDMGMSYVPGERGQYSEAVLRSLQLSSSGLDQLRERLRRSVAGEIEELFERCTQA
ncbi:MAG: HD-like signal output (HDOD) protein, partial [Candidatus Latescibacterota bacterium]